MFTSHIDIVVTPFVPILEMQDAKWLKSLAHQHHFYKKAYIVKMSYLQNPTNIIAQA